MEESSTKDWQAGSISSTNLYMLENGLCSDIILRVGQAGEPLHAHKFMLISRSPVFCAMFCGQLAETGREVIIPDIEADIMKAFLSAIVPELREYVQVVERNTKYHAAKFRPKKLGIVPLKWKYLYTEEEEIAPDTVMGLMYASKKYALYNLSILCREYLEKKIDNDNVCTILEQAHIFDEKELRDQCFSTIFSNSDKILKGPLKDYQNLCYECLKKLLESDQLKTKEETIFVSCLNWAEEQCHRRGLEISDENLREVLGDILYLIRFPNMSQRAFTELVSDRDILTSEEKIAVFQSFNRAPRDGDRPSLRGVRFPSKPRNRTEIYRINRFQEVVGGTFDFWLNDNFCDAISFMSSRDINLFGVAVFCPFPKGLIRGSIQLYDESNWCMKKQDNLEIIYNEKEKMQDVKFRGSVKIEKEKWYTIMQQMTGSKSYFGIKGLRQVHGEGVVVTFRNSPMYKNNTDVDSGQIPALLYS